MTWQNDGQRNRGKGVWSFEQDGPFVNVTYDWTIRANKPIFRSNHNWTMKCGEESLRLELLRRRAQNVDELARVPPSPRASRVIRILRLNQGQRTLHGNRR